MPTEYVNVNWIFDQDRFSAAVKRASDQHGVSDLAEMLELSDASIINWGNGFFHKDAPYPNMTNFLAVCNLLDLHPAIFFWVGEGRKE